MAQTLRGVRIGVVGLGRFGRAFGELLASAGADVLGYDSAPGSAPPAVRAVGSHAELCAGCRFVALATPVSAVSDALTALRAHLTPRHVVFDVGSVKLLPMRAMADLLGERVPWLGTHPLFGPVSLALGERPLTVVICPSERHAPAADSVRELLRAAGCHLVERTPEEHDREMARTHALAYLIAKGALDAELSLDSEIAPPSARAIARTIESARADSGHLLATLHRDNPYAADVRRRFLDALAAAHRALSAAEERDAPAAAPPEPEPTLPDLGARSPELREVRELIDDVDRELVALLARRVHLARRARAAKSALGHGVRDEQREQTLLERRRARARALHLPEDRVARLFEEILSLSREAQQEDPEPPS